MAEVLVLGLVDGERLASDRRKATMAARLLACCLGIPAEPAFDLSSSQGRNSGGVQLAPYGSQVCKDLFEFPNGAEMPEVQLLLVDEHGKIMAESRECFRLGQGLELLQRLPLPLSPRAERWVRDCLGEAGLETGQPAQPASDAKLVHVGDAQAIEG